MRSARSLARALSLFNVTAARPDTLQIPVNSSVLASIADPMHIKRGPEVVATTLENTHVLLSSRPGRNMKIENTVKGTLALPNSLADEGRAA
jgi:hypothetical protein